MLNLLRAEILKYIRLKLILFIAFAPALITLLIAGVFLFMKLAGVDFGDVPVAIGLSAIGGGTFGLASNFVIMAVNGIYLIGLVIAGAMVGSNEYGWHTIKMLATREPSRPRIMLSKTLFLLSLTGFMAGLAALCWLALGLLFKAFYNNVGDTGSLDGDAIGKGFLYLLFSFGVNFLWSALAMFLAVRFKSVVVAIIFYFIINTVDGIVSSIGEAALSGQLGTRFPNWLEPLINIAKFISPFLVNFSLNQLTASPNNPNFIQTISAVQSIIVLLVWMGLFIWAAVAVFRRRDITE
jgi:ABC-type transport system involved in multi-copper enzyme maturation permease subunit